MAEQIKVLESKFSNYTNSVIIQSVNGKTKVVYDVRLQFDNMELSVIDLGIKEGKKRLFTYAPNIRNLEYRHLDENGKNKIIKDYIDNNLPIEILDLATIEFIKSIKVIK